MKEVLCLYNGCFFFVYDYWPLFEQKIFFYIKTFFLYAILQINF